MKFIDVAHISVKAGDGGAGMSHFRREKHVPNGGPDGGNGGEGGSVFFEADTNLSTLLDFRYKRHHEALDGEKGGTAHKYGKSAEDLVLKVPCGTVVTDADTKELVGEVLNHGDRLLVAKGGRGGIGNKCFANSRNQSPTKTNPPEPGERRSLIIELKMIADIGIIGAPNAGKSTLISVISAARPKVADYPFTTLVPTLGVVSHRDAAPFVVADVPGLIPGASEGKGLGFEFLRHVERSQFLVHLIDASQETAEAMIADYEGILRELAVYDDQILGRPRLTVLSKIELCQQGNTTEDAPSPCALFKKYLTDKKVTFLEISSATRLGIDKLLDELVRVIQTNEK